jgi:assimilatory nitrate reductase catalytic subunit
VLATPNCDGTAVIAGDPRHPANFGRLCSKGSALGETLSLDGRLLHPLINGERASWDRALELVARRFSETIAEHGPDSVAFYVSGQILTEDYYVANKLMKGYIGSANIDTNSRLCMASSVAGHKRALGSDTVPGSYEDFDEADLVVLVGSNLAWCHPILFQRLAAAKEKRGTKVVVIDPRRTATCEIADMHLAIAPGSDVALFNGLLQHLDRNGAFDRAYIDAHTMGLGAALDVARAGSLAELTAITGLAEPLITAFYALFSATERTVTVYSQGVNQSSAGTDKVNAILNCHLATGRIGKPGMGPFSVTGQPNAMGGREVGGLANMLAAHMELGHAEHRRIVQSFWNSPRIAATQGHKAVDMFQAVADGRIKAVWIMATNPVDSMPEANNVAAALAACPFVVVSDVMRHTDTTRYAHVLLPSAAWGEKDGTVTNSERRISRQRAFLPLPGEAKPDWWQMAEVGRRMGFAEAFAWESASEIFAEYARLTGAENAGTRDLDISAYSDISAAGYAALEPFQWPQPAGRGVETTRFFANGHFYTPDRRARFVPVVYRAPGVAPSRDYPFVLNTGRVRDQWHTMTRTAKTARLMSHIAEPFVEIHPSDAERLGLSDAALAEITSPHGKAVARVLITDRQRLGSLFVPIHWTDQYASLARIDALVGAMTDPVSGQPELKAAPASITRFEAAWYGFAVMRAPPSTRIADYWALAPAKSGWRVELAGRAEPADWDEFAPTLLGVTAGDTDDVISFHDKATGQCRFAAFEADKLVGALFIAREPVSVARGWAADRLAHPVASPRDRFSILSGRAGASEKDRGAIVCACFEVGVNEIVEAITRGGSLSVEAVSAKLKAGTNCGSCRAEIGRLVHEHRVKEAV